jgi:hypothetical protein
MDAKYIVWYCPECKRDFIREIRSASKSSVRIQCMQCMHQQSFLKTTVHGIYDNPVDAKRNMITFNLSKSNISLSQQQILLELGENFTFYEGQKVERIKTPKKQKPKIKFKKIIEEFVTKYGSAEIEIKELKKYAELPDDVFDKMVYQLTQEGSLIEKSYTHLRYMS